MIPLTIIVPAYNEEAGIEKTLKALLSFCSAHLKEYQIIALDDASTDQTASRIEKYKEVELIRNPLNIGYGGSITRGLKQARFEHVLIIDADDTYPAEEIEKLLPYAEDFDMVVGERIGKHLRKKLRRFIFSKIARYVTGEKVPDANSGLRIFKKSIVMKFEKDFCMGFSFTTTITLVLLSNGYFVKFIPVQYRRREGKSKVRFSDMLRTIQILVHTVSFYNPIKAFLPFSILSFAVSVLFAAFYMFKSESLFYGLSAVLFFLSSMLFFGLGILGYIIVKASREKNDIN